MKDAEAVLDIIETIMINLSLYRDYNNTYYLDNAAELLEEIGSEHDFYRLMDDFIKETQRINKIKKLIYQVLEN